MLIKSKLKSHTLSRDKFLPFEMDILNMYIFYCKMYFPTCNDICRLHLYLSLSDSDCSSDKNQEAVSTEQVELVSLEVHAVICFLLKLYLFQLYENFVLVIHKVTYSLKYYFS